MVSFSYLLLKRVHVKVRFKLQLRMKEAKVSQIGNKEKAKRAENEKGLTKRGLGVTKY